MDLEGNKAMLATHLKFIKEMKSAGYSVNRYYTGRNYYKGPAVGD